MMSDVELFDRSGTYPGWWLWRAAELIGVSLSLEELAALAAGGPVGVRVVGTLLQAKLAAGAATASALFGGAQVTVRLSEDGFTADLKVGPWCFIAADLPGRRGPSSYRYVCILLRGEDGIRMRLAQEDDDCDDETPPDLVDGRRSDASNLQRSPYAPAVVAVVQRLVLFSQVESTDELFNWLDLGSELEQTVSADAAALFRDGANLRLRKFENLEARLRSRSDGELPKIAG